MLGGILEIIETEHSGLPVISQELVFEAAAGVLLAAHADYKPKKFSSLLTASVDQLKANTTRYKRYTKTADHSVNLWGRYGTSDKQLQLAPTATATTTTNSKPGGIPLAVVVEELALIRDIAGLFAIKYSEQCDLNEMAEADSRGGNGVPIYDDQLSLSGVSALFCAINPFAAAAVDLLPSTRDRIEQSQQAETDAAMGINNTKTNRTAAAVVDKRYIPSTDGKQFNVILELLDLLHLTLTTLASSQPLLLILICETIAAASEPSRISEYIRDSLSATAENDSPSSAAAAQPLVEAVQTGAEILRHLTLHPQVHHLSAASRACLCAAAVQLGVGFVFSPTSGLAASADERAALATGDLNVASWTVFNNLDKALAAYVRPAGAVPAWWPTVKAVQATPSLTTAHWALVDIASQSLFLRSLEEDRNERLAMGSRKATEGSSFSLASEEPTSGSIRRLVDGSKEIGPDAALPIFGITVGGDTGGAAKRSFIDAPASGMPTPLVALTPKDATANELSAANMALSPPFVLVGELLQQALMRQSENDNSALGARSSLFAVHLQTLFEDGGDDLRATCDKVCTCLYASLTQFIDAVPPDVWDLIPHFYIPHLMEGYANAMKYGATESENSYRHIPSDETDNWRSGEGSASRLRHGFVARTCVWKHIRRCLLSREINWNEPGGISTLAAYAHLMVAVKVMHEMGAVPSTQESSPLPSTLAGWLHMLFDDTITVARATVTSVAPYQSHDAATRNVLIAPESRIQTTIVSYLMQRAATTYENVSAATETEVVVWRGTFALAKCLLECTSGWAEAVEQLCNTVPVTEFLRDFTHAILSGPYHQWSHLNYSWRLQYEACDTVVEHPELFENIPYLVAAALRADALEHALQAPASSLCAAKQVRLAHWLCERHPEALRSYTVEIVNAIAAHVGSVGSVVAANSSHQGSAANGRYCTGAAARLADPHYAIFASSWIEFVHSIFCAESYEVLALLPSEEHVNYVCDAIGVCCTHAAFSAARDNQLVIASHDTSIGFGASTKARDVLLKGLEILSVVAAYRPQVCAAASVPVYYDSSSHIGTQLSFVTVLLAFLFEVNSLALYQGIASLITDVLVHVRNGEVSERSKATMPGTVRQQLRALIEKRLVESSLTASDDVSDITTALASKASSSTQLSNKSRSAPTREPSTSKTPSGDLVEDTESPSVVSMPTIAMLTVARSELSYARLTTLRTLFNYDSALFFRVMQGVDKDGQDTPSIEWFYNALEAIVKNNGTAGPKEAAEGLALLMELQLDARVTSTMKALTLAGAKPATSSLTATATSSVSSPLAATKGPSTDEPLAFLIRDHSLWSAIRSGDIDAIFDNEMYFASQSLPQLLWLCQLCNFKTKSAIAATEGRGPGTKSSSSVVNLAWWAGSEASSELSALRSASEALGDVIASLLEECSVASTTIDIDEQRNRHSFLGDGSIIVKHPLSFKAAHIAQRETERFNTQILLQGGEGIDGAYSAQAGLFSVVNPDGSSTSYVSPGDEQDMDNSNPSASRINRNGRGFSQQAALLANVSYGNHNVSSALNHNNDSRSRQLATYTSRVTFQLEAQNGSTLVGSSDFVTKRAAMSNSLFSRRGRALSTLAVPQSTITRAQIVTSDHFEVDQDRYQVKRYPYLYGSHYALAGTRLDPLYNMTLSVVDVFVRLLRAVESTLAPVAGAIGANDLTDETFLRSLTDGDIQQLCRIVSQAARISAVCKPTCKFIAAAVESLSHQCHMVIISASAIVNRALANRMAPLTRDGCLPTTQKILVHIDAMLANALDRANNIAGNEASMGTSASDLNINVWARCLHASSLLLRFASLVATNTKSSNSYQSTDETDNAHLTPDRERLANVELRKNISDQILDMLSRWVSEHTDETRREREQVGTVDATATQDEIKRLASNAKIIYDVTAIVLGNVFVPAPLSQKGFMKAAQASNPSIFTPTSSNINNSYSPNTYSNAGHQMSVASPSVIKLLKAVWGHAMVASGQAYPMEPIPFTSSDAWIAPTTISSATAPQANDAATKAIASVQQSITSNRKSAFTMALDALQDIFTTVPVSVYHLDSDSFISLLAILGNQYEVDAVLPSVLITTASAVSAPGSQTAGAIQPTSGTPLVVPAQANFKASPVLTSATSPMLLNADRTPSSAAPSVVSASTNPTTAIVASHHPRQTQWHHAWVQMLKISIHLAGAAAPKWASPIAVMLGSSKRVWALLPILQGHVIGRPKPTVEQCEEASQIALLLATLTVHGSGAALRHCDLTPMYPWARRAFTWLSVNHKFFRKTPSHGREWSRVLGDLMTTLLAIPVTTVAGCAGNNSTAGKTAKPLSISARTAKEVMGYYATHCLSLLPQEGYITFESLMIGITHITNLVQKIGKPLNIANHGMGASMAATPRTVGISRGASPQRSSASIGVDLMPPSPTLGTSYGDISGIQVHESADESWLLCELAFFCDLVQKCILLYTVHWQYFYSYGAGRGGLNKSCGEVADIPVTLPQREIKLMEDLQERFSNHICNFAKVFLEDGQIKSGLPEKLDNLLKTLEKVVLLQEATLNRS